MTADQEQHDVIVYVSPGSCQPCKATIRAMQKYGIEFKRLVCNETSPAQKAARSYGYVQAPVVVAGDDHWSGFNPDKIKELAIARGLIADRRMASANA